MKSRTPKHLALWTFICLGAAVACALDPIDDKPAEKGAETGGAAGEGETGGTLGSAGTSAGTTSTSAGRAGNGSGGAGGTRAGAGGIGAAAGGTGAGAVGGTGSSGTGAATVGGTGSAGSGAGESGTTSGSSGSAGSPPAAGGGPGPCDLNPCNAGTCAVDGTSFTCTCEEGHSGTLCEIAPGSCSSNPCQNSGTCEEQGATYTCSCVPGFSGVDCETDIDECAASPCRNGGTCRDDIDAYHCSCTAGWEGTNCEKNIDECASRPCQNGGVCTDAVNAYTCACAAGWGGMRCEINADNCLPGSCLNDGVCMDGLDDFTCSCPSTFSGRRCESGTLTVDASDRGWYDSTGLHDQWNKNTFTGYSAGTTANAYLTFTLPDFDGTVLGVDLRLEHEAFASPDASEQFSIWDVSTPAATLTLDSRTAVAVYNDLGGGVRHATFTLSTATLGTVRTIGLNTQARTAVSAARGSTFSLGFKLDTRSTELTEEYARFSYVSEVRVHQLVIVLGP